MWMQTDPSLPPKPVASLGGLVKMAHPRSAVWTQVASEIAYIYAITSPQDALLARCQVYRPPPLASTSQLLRAKLRTLHKTDQGLRRCDAAQGTQMSLAESQRRIGCSEAKASGSEGRSCSVQRIEKPWSLFREGAVVSIESSPELMDRH